MKHSNISIFVPHIGCPNMCSFCNQNTISGADKAPSAGDVRSICAKALSEIREPENTEIAFFGGSFTAIERRYMTELLEAANEFIGEGKFYGIRISTRPDCVDREILELLKKYGVTAIELGAQSMSDDVLEANDRGHNAQDVENASRLIREYGFELGLQMMVGLYKSTIADEFKTIDKIIEICPDTVRIYPVVILKNTKLGELLRSGIYKPFYFDDVVEIVSEAMTMFTKRGIRVIKCGLHASEFVENDMVGGFYHPAFRELSESRLCLKKLEELAGECSLLRVAVPYKEASRWIGHKKCNIANMKEKGIELQVKPEQTEKIYIIERR